MAITQENSVHNDGLGKPSTMEHLALLAQARWNEIEDKYGWLVDRVWDGKSLSDYESKAGSDANLWVNTETGDIDILDYKTTSKGQRKFWIDSNGVAWMSIGRAYSDSPRNMTIRIGALLEDFVVRTYAYRDREVIASRQIFDHTTPSAITAEEWMRILEDQSQINYEPGGEILDLAATYAAPLFREQFEDGSVEAKKIRRFVEDTVLLKVGPAYRHDLYFVPRNMRRVLKLAYGDISDKELIIELQNGSEDIADSFADVVDTYLYFAVNKAYDKFVSSIRDTSMPNLIAAAAKYAPRLLARSTTFAAYSGQIQIMTRHSNLIGLVRRLFGRPRSKDQFLSSTAYIGGLQYGERIDHYLDEHPQIEKLSKVLPSGNRVSPVRDVTDWKLKPGRLSHVDENEEYKLYLASEAFESWVSRL